MRRDRRSSPASTADPHAALEAALEPVIAAARKAPPGDRSGKAAARVMWRTAARAAATAIDAGAVATRTPQALLWIVDHAKPTDMAAWGRRCAVAMPRCEHHALDRLVQTDGAFATGVWSTACADAPRPFMLLRERWSVRDGRPPPVSGGAIAAARLDRLLTGRTLPFGKDFLGGATVRDRVAAVLAADAMDIDPHGFMTSIGTITDAAIITVMTDIRAEATHVVAQGPVCATGRLLGRAMVAPWSPNRVAIAETMVHACAGRTPLLHDEPDGRAGRWLRAIGAMGAVTAAGGRFVTDGDHPAWHPAVAAALTDADPTTVVAMAIGDRIADPALQPFVAAWTDRFGLGLLGRVAAT